VGHSSTAFIPPRAWYICSKCIPIDSDHNYTLKPERFKLSFYLSAFHSTSTAHLYYPTTQYAPPLCSQKASPTSQSCRRTSHRGTFLLCRSQLSRSARLDCTAIPTAAITIIPARSMIIGKGILGSNIGSLPQLFPGGVAAIWMSVLKRCQAL
jgi:hypothetical protein